MNVIALSFVRNEADIIEAFVRHTLTFADRVLIADHRSVDATPDILKRLIAEGLPVEMQRVEGPAYCQKETLTSMLRDAATRFSPDWIFPLDADEFFVAPENVLDGLPQVRVTLIPWRTYVPLPSDDASQPHLLRRITHHRAREFPPFHKVLIPRTIAADPGVSLTLGSHDVLRADDSPYLAEECDGIFLAHFPVRSAAQLRSKVIRGWKSHLQDPHRLPGQIVQWQNLWDRCSDPRPINADELRDIALAYAKPLNVQADPNLLLDPVHGPHAELRYPEFQPARV